MSCAYLDNGFNLGAVRQTQKNLVALYREDMVKHADDRALQVKAIYDSIPAQLDKENRRFKLYLSDVGMLMSQYKTDVALAALAGELKVNFGGIYENVVAQELATWGVPFHYYHHTKLGEVDFIGEAGSKVLPIGVKSGKDYRRHVALNNLLRFDEYGIEFAYMLSESNVSTEIREGKPVRYLPLYMLPLVARELSRGSLDGIAAEPPVWE
ncbi:DUF4143 domain-containing protein [Coriobacteriales bacterium OH1046]|nr:DUF4143 domain-containing protein [Coriobacteriales bacterium OH1046]